MSLRHAIRSRFKSAERESGGSGGPDGMPTKCKTAPPPAAASSEPGEMVEKPVSEQPPAPAAEGELGGGSVYEQQLSQLQEQLVAAIIENHSLAAELEEIKEQHKVKQLEQELELERERAQELERRLCNQDWVDVAQEVQEDGPPAEEGGGGGLRASARRWLLGWLIELLDDLRHEPPAPPPAAAEDDQLTVKKLKENIKRFKSGSKPIYTSVKGVYSVLQWKYPAFSLLAFMVYMYSVWHGWLIPVFLFLVIFRLFINYLRYKGWNINIRYFTAYVEEERSKEAERDLGVSDKFNLVLQVARKVQNSLGTIADNLEKLKNLVTWQQPEASARLFLALCAAFTASCLLPGDTLALLAGLYLGVKFFIIEYLYHRFPRLKDKHDTVHKIWQTLPTDADLQRAYIRHATTNRSTVSPETGSSEDECVFSQLFNLPPTEQPLTGWEGGRRCTLVNKDKPLSSAFKHGKLYLTTNFLCFERYKTPSPKNLLVALSDVTHISKAKPYSWMPGGGMSIEVTLAGFDRPYIFGALLGRDELFDTILAHGAKANMPWAHTETAE